MLDQDSRYGILLQQDAKIHRKYFDELVKLIGIIVIYREPKEDKHWTRYSEIESNYKDPISVGCIFTQHPDQKTMRKLGWVAELQEETSLIHVPYYLPGIQVGALFIIPSGLDNASGRLFRVTQMQNSIIYPSSIACTVVPEYENTYDPSLNDFKTESFNVINEEEFDGLY